MRLEGACLDHGIENVVALLPGQIGVAQGIVAVGGRQHAHQQRGSGHAETGGRAIEIKPRRFVKARQARAQIDAVQIGAQQPPFAVKRFQLQGHGTLAPLAREGVLPANVGWVERAGQLLRYRAAALADARLLPIDPGRARHADGIDANVPVIAAVFRGNDSLAQLGGKSG